MQIVYVFDLSAECRRIAPIKMMWWAVWCAAMVAGSVFTAAAPPTDSIDLMQMDPSLADDESLGFAMQSLSGRYAAAPWLYLLADVSHDPQRMAEFSQSSGRARPKRKMPSLSINNPMEVLRQRLLLEVARKQMREANQRQAVANRLFLQNVGKRGAWGEPASYLYNN
ncbi:diuretic hormone 41 isoform X1 [Bombyx mori]|uniref:Corticotropin-releasing factor domain-containing protein n=1 Tax=Bombyx mori TaxID=7091 RepID=A0A8R2GAL4_BOMMO|nr:corticotropin-releasing factor-like diuretic hormone isoform X1 [Bombyx mori]